MSRRRRLAIIASAVILLSAALTYAAMTRDQRGLFSPIRPYVFRERVVCWDSKLSGGKFYVHGMHLRGIDFTKTKGLINDRVLASGHTKVQSGTTWISYEVPGRPKAGFIPDGAITIGKAEGTLNDGVVVAEIRIANQWDMWVARVKNLGRKPFIADDDLMDLKKFFGE